MEKKTWERCVSLVRRYERRLLAYRVLREPTPEVKRYVIVFTVGNCKPLSYFRYDYEEVWCWSKSVHRAAIFRSYDMAEQAAKNCSLYYQSSYQIRQLP